MSATPFTFNGGSFNQFELRTNALANHGSFVNKQVLCRLRHLALVPGSAIVGALDLIAGTALVTASLLTLGKVKKLSAHGDEHLFEGRNVLAKPFIHLLRTVNPCAQAFEIQNNKAKSEKELNGFTAEKLGLGRLGDFADKQTRSANAIKKHVISRLSYTLLALALVVSRVADAVLAIPLAVVALATAGKVRQINTIAYQCLQFPCIVGEFLIITTSILNPQA